MRAESDNGQVPEEAVLEVPEAGRDEFLSDQVNKLSQEMEKIKWAAFELGRDPKQRALEAGREWKEGDGY